MNGSRQRIPLWRRLPRAVYWMVGGAIALFGAMAANGVAAQLPLQQKFWAWIVGSIFIFGGLMVLSMGTKARLTDDDDENSTRTY
jgi:uncharacterized membrane protein YadS